jgi:hypothetical protein
VITALDRDCRKLTVRLRASERLRPDEGQGVAHAGELEYPLHAGWSWDQSQFPFRRAGSRGGIKDEVQPG